MRILTICGAVAIAALMSACSPSKGPVKPGVKIGKPYVIEGKTYYPAYDGTYDRTGDASWYGPGFHGKYTANGEVFDQDDLTAAHPTLPMPSLVRVTNLENGKSLIVRINDRGPFKKNRIIDLSRKSAQTLGVHSISKVRVQFLRHETEEYLADLDRGQNPSMAEINERTKDRQRMIAKTERIVETTIARTDPTQPVADAAPVTSVSAGNLEAPAKKVTLVREAMADENVPPPLSVSSEPLSPPAVEKSAPAVANSGVVINPNETITETEPAKPQKQAVKKEAPAEMAPAAGGSYLIQAGSFAAEENAQKLVSKLSGVAHAFIDRIEASGKTWWRVRVGAFKNREEADTILGKVRAAGVPDARVVKN